MQIVDLGPIFVAYMQVQRTPIYVITWQLIYRVIHEECHSFRELICHVMLMKKVHMNMGPIFLYYRKYEVYNIWNWIAINWSNQSNYWQNYTEWFTEIIKYLLHYYSPDKCILQYIFKHSAFCSNTRGCMGVNCSCRWPVSRDFTCGWEITKMI